MYKTIPVKPETKDRIDKLFKIKGDTYDVILNRVIDKAIGKVK